MAVKYEDIKHKLKNAPLNEKELNAIAKMEDYIDTKIKEEFDGGHININTEVLDFKFNPENEREYPSNVLSDIKSTRKELMKIRLMARFEEAGWKWELQEGQDDGPNRPAIDWWHLIGNDYE